MRILRWFLVFILLGLSSSVALADGIDPAIGVEGGTGSTLWTGSTIFTITSANFTSDTFFILTGTITNFDFNFGNTEQGPFSSLEGSAFPTVTTIVPGFEALLSGGTIFPVSACDGCPTGTQRGNQIFGDFRFVLIDAVIGSTVTVTSNVPEPGTLILMLSGLGAMVLRRPRRNKVPS
jgi:hypothetical protein